MKKVFLPVILTFVWMHVFSQNRINTDFELFNRNVVSASGGKISHELTYDDISGSPFLNADFIAGEVFLPDSGSFSNVLLRYNIYTDKMEFKNKNNQVLEIVEPERYDRFILGEQIFRYIPPVEGNRTEKGFFQVLADGHIALYKKLRINFQEAQKPGAYKDAQPPKFIVMPPEYYLSIHESRLEKVKGQKQALELLSSQKPDVTAFAKKEKLNLNKEEELKKAVEYCNQ
ncbi:MAG: hypothetical protein AB2L24_31085 [Mangrovibacterium sp.]